MALKGDILIQKLILASARVSSVGVTALSSSLPHMRAVEFLDLSSNLICDAGAYALAGALPHIGWLGAILCLFYFCLFGANFTCR